MVDKLSKLTLIPQNIDRNFGDFLLMSITFYAYHNGITLNQM